MLLYEGTISIYLEDFRMVELSQAYFRFALTLLLSRCNFSCQMTILNGFHIESEAKLTLESNYPTWKAKYERIIRQNWRCMWSFLVDHNSYAALLIVIKLYRRRGTLAPLYSNPSFTIIQASSFVIFHDNCSTDCFAFACDDGLQHIY